MTARTVLVVAFFCEAGALMGPIAMQGLSMLEPDADADAVEASDIGPSRPGPRGAKYMFLTMTSPSDKLPLQIMLPHQLRQVTQDPPSSMDVVVIQNHLDRDCGSPQDSFLDTIRSQRYPWLRVKEVDYPGVLDDEKFLSRHWVFLNDAGGRNMTVRKLPITSGNDTHELTNVAGMLTAMESCLDAEDSVELCLYMDPDIFVHRREKGHALLELASDVFASHPELAVLLPPTLCDAGHYLVGDGVCNLLIPPLTALSQRHLIFHRQRLRDRLPFKATLDKLEGAYVGSFENMNTHYLSDAPVPAAGLMRCGAETVAVHPPAGHEGTLSFTQQLAALAVYGPDKRSIPGFDDDLAKGSQVLVDRMEAGAFKSDLSIVEVAMELTNLGPYTDGCLGMRAKKEHIDAGLAF
eukprot:CAMPEP_0170241022 /NCGR_PEP_ID=MMETSP0116_2-20130129/20274_1 /TAXON_ID=400756 /ORGANISM="Durinskia baltica, Strain CSIRO CS-38" /LENGTH=407 /DNA_ID=CAMNT_0010491851 /DNA_START=103 /DNA_END=1326 /DNA_ORIENTATION=-